MKYLYLVAAHLWNLSSRPAGGSVTDKAVSVAQFRLFRRFEETTVLTSSDFLTPPQVCWLCFVPVSTSFHEHTCSHSEHSGVRRTGNRPLDISDDLSAVSPPSQQPLHPDSNNKQPADILLHVEAPPPSLSVGGGAEDPTASS